MKRNKQNQKRRIEQIEQKELAALKLTQDFTIKIFESIKARMSAGAAIEEGPLVLSPKHFDRNLACPVRERNVTTKRRPASAMSA